MSQFWKDRSVLITGHTGFKGTWLTLWLHSLGAKVNGFSIEDDRQFFKSAKVFDLINHIIGDIRDQKQIEAAVRDTDPEVVFHLAAQSLVLDSYQSPAQTWSTNVMGTVNLLEAMRHLNGSRVGIMVTTDKVYKNLETGRPFVEEDVLGGRDPYSASKSAMEIAVACWRDSFCVTQGHRIATVRAGNVIGGGDWSQNRIIPDIARAQIKKEKLKLRNPHSVRPWQHVLDPLSGYLRLAIRLSESDDPKFQSSFNFGPRSDNFRTVEELVKAVYELWPGSFEIDKDRNPPHEAKLLMLDTEKSRKLLGYESLLDFDRSVETTINWYKSTFEGKNPLEIALSQIEDMTAL